MTGRGRWPVARGPDSPSRDEEETPRSHRDLRVWREAVDWTEAVYRATATWPRNERFGLISQLRRAAATRASNIAEGAARRGAREFLSFLGIARGSLAEAETQLILGHRLGFLPQTEFDQLSSQASDISRMLAGLATSLERRGNR